MIKELKAILNKVIDYRKIMHEGTTSILVDNWIQITEQMIKELKYLGENDD